MRLSERQAASGISLLRLLFRDEELGNLFVRQFLGPVGRVDHQGGAAWGHPDEVVAELEDLAHLGVLGQDAEVGVALRLDRDRRHLGLVAFVDPDAADLQAIAAGHAAERRLL